MIFHARNPAFIPVVVGWPWPEFASALHPLADRALSAILWCWIPGASHSPLFGCAGIFPALAGLSSNASLLSIRIQIMPNKEKADRRLADQLRVVSMIPVGKPVLHRLDSNNVASGVLAA